SSDVIVAIAGAGTFDTLADNFSALRPRPHSAINIVVEAVRCAGRTRDDAHIRVRLNASPPQRMSPPCRYSKFVVARLALNATNANELDAGCDPFAQVSNRRGDE
ncbi:MAG: hypothetical protein K0R01_2745, partial [Mycobacterium sp.]|nr:hypothetical protein [Mycobacterium sp.]